MFLVLSLGPSVSAGSNRFAADQALLQLFLKSVPFGTIIIRLVSR